MTAPPLPFYWTGISADELRQEVSYDPSTGEFRWLINKRCVRAGSVAGSTSKGTRSKKRYAYLKIRQRLYAAHRAAWLYMTGEWPPLQIDHIDGDTLNNRWANLRLATASQNLANTSRQSNNSTGFKGVTLVKRTGKFRAQIGGGRKQWLGDFPTPEEAHAAYVAEAKNRFGEFARAS